MEKVFWGPCRVALKTCHVGPGWFRFSGDCRPIRACSCDCCFISTRSDIFERRRGAYDLYHEAAFFPFVAPNHVTTVFTLTDLSLIRFPEHHPRERVMYSRLFFHRRCKRVKRFLTISAFIQKGNERLSGVSAVTIQPLLIWGMIRRCCILDRFRRSKNALNVTNCRIGIFCLWGAGIRERIWTSFRKPSICQG